MSAKTLKGRARRRRARRGRRTPDVISDNCFQYDVQGGRHRRIGSYLVTYVYPKQYGACSIVVGTLPKTMRPTKAVKKIVAAAFKTGAHACKDMIEESIARNTYRFFTSLNRLHWKN